MRVPTEAWMASSSASSRLRACSGDSPASILPPGNSHFRPIGEPALRWQMSTSCPRRMSAAATKRSVFWSLPFCAVSAMLSHSLEAGGGATMRFDHANPLAGTESIRVQGRSDGAQPVDERGRGGVEQLIGDAIEAALAHRAQVLPARASGEFLERDAITGAAPCGQDDIGIGGDDGFGRGDTTGRAEEDAACGFYQFPDPALGMDERLPPTLRKN